LVHLLATDAHHYSRRPPLLAEGREAAAKWVGPEEAERLVTDRPKAIVENLDPAGITPPHGLGGPAWRRTSMGSHERGGWISRLFGVKSAG